MTNATKDTQTLSLPAIITVSEDAFTDAQNYDPDLVAYDSPQKALGTVWVTAHTAEVSLEDPRWSALIIAAGGGRAVAEERAKEEIEDCEFDTDEERQDALEDAYKEHLEAWGLSDEETPITSLDGRYGIASRGGAWLESHTK